jgi:hypothetical protein
MTFRPGRSPANSVSPKLATDIDSSSEFHQSHRGYWQPESKDASIVSWSELLAGPD